MMPDEEILAGLRYARQIHAGWVAYLRGEPGAGEAIDPRPIAEIVGSVEWHDRWIATYEAAITRLEQAEVDADILAQIG